MSKLFVKGAVYEVKDFSIVGLLAFWVVHQCRKFVVEISCRSRSRVWQSPKPGRNPDGADPDEGQWRWRWAGNFSGDNVNDPMVFDRVENWVCSCRTGAAFSFSTSDSTSCVRTFGVGLSISGAGLESAAT